MENKENKDNKKEIEHETFDELFGADPDCEHDIVSRGILNGGGVYCRKCNGWFCF